MKNIKKLCIVGVGGFAREVLLIAIELFKLEGINYSENTFFLVKDEDWSEEFIMGVPQLKESDFDPSLFEVIVAVGDPILRKKIVEKMPKNTCYTTLVHPNANVSDFVTIGEGVIITSGVKVTCNIVIGKHAQLNLNTIIGHDCDIGDYVTASPSVSVSGNCKIGERVFIGTGAVLREGLEIVNKVLLEWEQSLSKLYMKKACILVIH
ncbi:MAG: acetyltransferase [Flavobacteriaceae bacterium]|nr:acetyltransferase [Flavobacteriaceae bacterium]